MSRLLDEVPMPARIRVLPRNKAGYPIPWFVADIDGERDFRIADASKMMTAVRQRLCWLCGIRMKPEVAFVIGPMCAVNRISSEPPCHPQCARYAAMVCPFLTTPEMRRREGGKPDDLIPVAGKMIARNPGVALVWHTRDHVAFRAPMGNDGILFDIGQPLRTDWFSRGRPATREEVITSIDTGLPALLAACDLDDDPASSRAHVTAQVMVAMELVPVG